MRKPRGRGAARLRLAPGKFGKAMRFAEAGVCVNVGDHFPRARGAVAFWVRPDWDGGHQESCVCFHVPTSSKRTMDNYHVQTYGGNLSVRAGDMGDDGRPGATLNSTVQRAWKKGEWHHVAMCWSPTALRLFVDAKLVARDEQVAYPLEPKGELVIGSWSDGRRPAKAAIDEFWVFTRDLSAGEVQALSRGNALAAPR